MFIAEAGKPAETHDAAIRPEHFAPIARDAEADVVATQSRLAAFFQCSQDAVFMVDRSGHYLAVNAAFEIMLGQPAGAIEGKGFRDFIHPDDLAHNPGWTCLGGCREQRAVSQKRLAALVLLMSHRFGTML